LIAAELTFDGLEKQADYSQFFSTIYQ